MIKELDSFYFDDYKDISGISLIHNTEDSIIVIDKEFTSQIIDFIQ